MWWPGLVFFISSIAFAQNDAENEDETTSITDVPEAQARPRRSTNSVVHSEEAIEPRVSSNSGRITVHANQIVEEEKQLIDREVERGVVYLMGEANVSAGPKSSILKKVVVNYIYTFLRKNLTEGHKALSIPKDQLLKVGITYEI